jgi:serine/threonine-protein kinase RsbW
VALCIEDDGVPFDPTAQESPALATSLDEAHVGGHGLRLMRHYLHRMLYRRAPDRNVLLLEVAL